jgi:amino-acid N-acetyltransferase
MNTRRAIQQDLERIGSLLAEGGLPALPSNLPLSNVMVALEGNQTIGGIALEVRARSGLLRSVVVSPEHRRQGVGASLVHSIVARAHELGLRDLYLLAGDPSGFFAAAGFTPVDRSEVPSEIRATCEYAEQCPESAVVMSLPLATRW